MAEQYVKINIKFGDFELKLSGNLYYDPPVEAPPLEGHVDKTFQDIANAAFTQGYTRDGLSLSFLGHQGKR